MKKLLLLLFINFLFSNYCKGQNPLVKQWDKDFGGTFNDYLFSIQQTINGGFILGGVSWSGMGGDKTQSTWGGPDYWIVKTDSLGNKLWDKDFGWTSADELLSIQETTDSGFILGGYSNSGIGGDKTQAVWNNSYDYWIVKTDLLGNKQWDKDFGGTGADYLYSIQQTTDGGFILGGYSTSGIGGDKTQPLWGGAGDYDYWIVKTDSLGNKQWDKDFGGTSADELTSIQQTADGGYILGGYSNSGIGGNKTQAGWGYDDYWIVKTDSLGNKQWDKDFGGTSADDLFSIQQTKDGGFILGGLSLSGIGGDKTHAGWGWKDYWIVKTDSLGNKLWDKDFGGTNYEDEFGSIMQTYDGGYLMAGASYSPISGDKTENNLGVEQTWVVKIDSLGNKQWDKTLHTNINSFHDDIGLAIETRDGCYLMANYTATGIGGDKTQANRDTINYSTDYWIIKFCDSTLTSGLTPAPPPDRSGGEGVAINPNPSSGNFTIILPHPINKGKVEIYNSFGEKIFTENILNASQKEIHLKTPQGIYFVKVIDEEKQYRGKIIIE